MLGMQSSAHGIEALFLTQTNYDYQLVNCGGVTRNLRALTEVMFDCSSTRKQLSTTSASVDLRNICSDNVYYLDANHWERWWRLWSVHINEGYNWVSGRFLGTPYSKGRSRYALKLVYQAFSATLTIVSPQKNIIPTNIVFSNRKGKRRVVNMNDIVKFASEALSGIATVNASILFFEQSSIWHTGTVLRQSNIWVSPHGANMANMIYMNRGTTVIELLPFRCQRLRIFFQSMASALSLKYHSLEPVEASDVDGLGSNTNENPLLHDKIAFSRRSCDSEQCVRGEDWEYMNFTIDPQVVTDSILSTIE